jgi:hypothetical protein
MRFQLQLVQTCGGNSLKDLFLLGFGPFAEMHVVVLEQCHPLIQSEESYASLTDIRRRMLRTVC